MKTNSKAKAAAASRKASARKTDREKNLSARASNKKRKKEAGKLSVRSPEKRKKSAPSAKESPKAGKKLPAGPAAADKKIKVKKAPAKSPKASSKAVKRKTVSPKTKPAKKKAANIALPKASPISIKSSPKTKGKTAEKIKLANTSVRKKSGNRPVKPSASTRPGKVGRPAVARKRKSPPRLKERNEFNNIPIHLPEEYGENELISIAVDPNVVFVDWEIKKDEVPEAKDSLTLRVFDVPGGEPMMIRRGSYFDIKIEGRVGNGFFDIGRPGREVSFEIGHFDKGKFLPILRSRVISMPRLLVPDELGIALKLFDAGIPLGY